MEIDFASYFEDVWHERPLVILLSLTDPDVLKQSGFMDVETETSRSLPLEGLHRQIPLEDYVALSI